MKNGNQVKLRMNQIKIEDVIKLEDKAIIDVRSSYEFNNGTIPKAINIPLLDDYERIEVGKSYKKEGAEAAKIKGLDFISPKLTSFYREVKELQKNSKNLIVFCSRGGLRSTTFVKLMDLLGAKGIYQLQGGFKEYRSFILKSLMDLKKIEFIVIHGHTGVGKTDIIEKLKLKGIPAINLEELAQNKGSVFGNIGFNGITTQKNFENSIAEEIIVSKDKPIVIESEGQRLGNVTIPKIIYNNMINGHHVLLKTSIDNRKNRLVNDYVNKREGNDHKLIDAVNKLKKRLGHEKVQSYIKLINEKKYDLLAEALLEHYYDPLYNFSIEKYDYDIIINYDRIEEAIEVISRYYKEIEGKTR
ncbi:tRNA 2-selenouridine(34) synthase MnmH [Alkaliphilus pronyensis]|uniref:tRNA 2-selenouridine(34) synthase MnmH n=1 Tax=Alkaliphilus pronyensis TaxID=1482732 RepID=A0A6I0FCK5_9FIRM|nr:tRNA 2-selenouridine(34) synthase MnmH [Alkaliphilus pronyensis]KAB3536956.1 tRNA 2-selenouridine(34) synthase MnmH [Alkaliphilus pronyensis]